MTGDRSQKTISERKAAEIKLLWNEEPYTMEEIALLSDAPIEYVKNVICGRLHFDIAPAPFF